jgi:endoglucanase
MLKKSFGKRAASGIITAAMLATTAAASLPGMALTASAAGEMLGQTNFDKGIGLPWHTCVTQPAELKFDISGGTYNIEIVNNGGVDVGGADRWDCQFRHRKLELYSGNSYHVHAEVTADHSGEIFAKISDLAGGTDVWHNTMGGTNKASYGAGKTSIGETWDCIPVTANETLIIDADFTCSQDLVPAEFAFHFGGAGQYQKTDCFPEGTKLTFDNMSLYNNTDDRGVWVDADPAPEYPVHGNQVGYYTKLAKKATVHDKSATTVYILDAKTGKEAWKGTPSAAKDDFYSGMSTQVIDFSDFQTAGTYYFSLDGKTRASYDFAIGDDIYNEHNTAKNGNSIVANALNYFYQNRAGVPISESYITSMGENDSKTPLAHTQYGHQPDTAYIQNTWIKAYKNDGSDVQKGNGELTASDGWYDAGDHGKYVVNGGIAVWTLQNMYEWTLNSANNSDAKKFADGSSSIVVPESSNGTPDILDETKVELEFFKEMLVPSSYKMTYNAEKDGKPIGSDTKVYTDMVFHKLHDSKWTGLAVHAWDYMKSKDWAGITRIVKPPSTAATLNAAACFAQGARLFKASDATYAAELEDLAKRTYKAAKANPELYAPLDQAIGGGAYGDDNVLDDFYWAATELYITTGDSAYLTDLEGYKEAYKVVYSLDGGENSGSFTSFNWGNTAGLGTLSMYLNADKFPSKAADIKKSITAAADAYLAQEASEGFGVPYKGTKFTDPINIPKNPDGTDQVIDGYEWGSNSMVINNAIVMAYAYSATGEAKYLNGVSEATDYIFGRNAMDLSYVTGYGTYHCFNPHHRYWSHENDPTFPYAPSGVMSGGPNAGMQDPYVAGMGYVRGKVASQLCYVDSIEAWSVNEVTINWNSPFAWVMSFLEDEANEAPNQGDDPTEASWGDANCSKEAADKARVTVADAVLVARVVAQDAVTITEEGKLNGDVNESGALDANDTVIILQYAAGLVPFGSKTTAS